MYTTYASIPIHLGCAASFVISFRIKPYGEVRSQVIDFESNNASCPGLSTGARLCICLISLQIHLLVLSLLCLLILNRVGLAIGHHQLCCKHTLMTSPFVFIHI